MVKEVVLIAGGAIVIGAVIAAVMYMREHQNEEDVIDRTYIDELTMREVKEWFSSNMKSEPEKGLLLYPTKENTQKWNIKMPTSNNVLLQAVYNSNTDTIVRYREISFSTLSDKVKELLDNNGGTIVIES